MGLACARRLAGTVDALFVVDRDEDGVAAVAEELAGTTRTMPFALDVTDAGRISALRDAVAAEGTLRSVAHAAGVSPTMADWETVVNVDLVGSALLVEALTSLVVPGTAMVCFASMAAAMGGANAEPAVDAALDDPLSDDLLGRLRTAAGELVENSGMAYGLAKRGVVRLVQRTAIAWGPLGARINSISPGLIDTPMGRQEFEQQPAMTMMLDLTPLRREGTADEEAAVVKFLLSDEASFVTGIDVLVDGGVVAAMQAMAAPA
jgi:NAD(P)-dependent dehydrogenase (short-subunit alcohol dehydrogenase family)